MQRPLPSIGQLIDNSWELYQKHFYNLMSISGWYGLVIFVSVLIAIYYPDVSTILSTAKPFSTGETATVIGAVVHQLIFNPLVSLWVGAALILYVQQAIQGKSPNPTRCLVQAKSQIWPLIWTGIVYFGYVFGPSIGVLVPGALLMTLGGVFSIGFLSTIGSLLFLVGIPASLALLIKLYVDYLFFPYVVLLMNKRGKKALTASKALIHPYWWRAIAHIGIPTMLFVIIAILVLVLLSMISGSMISTVSHLNTDVYARLTNINQAILPQLIFIFSYPMVLAVFGMVYEEINEGA